MRDFPVLKIELENVRETVMHALISRNDAINKMVIESLESQLTEEWVQVKINQSVKDCLSRALDDVASEWKLRQAISSLVADQVEKMVESAKNSGA